MPVKETIGLNRALTERYYRYWERSVSPRLVWKHDQDSLIEIYEVSVRGLIEAGKPGSM